MNKFKKDVVNQFDTRASVFDKSANWITSPALIHAHLELIGHPRKDKNSGIELCCGTGQIGRALSKIGWKMQGLDISNDMKNIASNFFPALCGDAEKTPFKQNSFDLAVIRQALFFLNAKSVLAEIKRILKKDGYFLLSQTVPFSDKDENWLKKIHIAKQAQMVKFYTACNLEKELIQNGFEIIKKANISIKESITKWMDLAPELDSKKKDEICNMVANSPDMYKKARNVQIINGEIFEDWNWVIFKSRKAKGGI